MALWCGAVFLLAAGCPKAPPTSPTAVPLTPEQQLERDVALLTERTQELVRAQDTLLWEVWTQAKPLDTSAVTEKAHALYSKDAIGRITELRSRTADPLDARALDQLRLHFESEYLAQATLPESRALSQALSSLSFTSGEQRVAFRDLDRLLARERNALLRKELQAGAMAALPTLDGLFQARRARTAAVLRELGYADTLTFAAALRRTDLDALAKDAEALLAKTDARFDAVIAELAARELRMPVEGVRLRDLLRMFRSRDVDELFPPEAIPRRVEETLEGLGVPLSKLPNVQLDAAPRQTRNSAPLAIAIVVPEDVRVSYQPAPGLRHQAAYLHEVGHALHAGLTRERRYALAKLGAAAPAKAWPLLLELLTEDPKWLEEHAGLRADRLDRYLAASRAWDLFLVRQAAARFLYTYRLHSAPGGDPKALYKDVMERAMRVPIEEGDLARALLDTDDFFESAQRLEAHFLAHQLQAQLRARFGDTWWKTAEAGAWLRTLWAHGNALNAAELARVAGDQTLGPGALVTHLGQ